MSDDCGLAYARVNGLQAASVPMDLPDLQTSVLTIRKVRNPIPVRRPTRYAIHRFIARELVEAHAAAVPLMVTT